MNSRKLIKFIRSGELAQLKLGMTLKAVIDYLGWPDFYHSIAAFWADYPRAYNYAVDVLQMGFMFVRYESVELTFDVVKDELITIKLEFYPNYKRYVRYPKRLGLTCIHQYVGTSLERFKKFANQHGLALQTLHIIEDSITLYRPGLPIWIIFVKRGGTDTLHTIQVSSLIKALATEPLISAPDKF